MGGCCAKVAVLSPQTAVAEGFRAMLNRYPDKVEIIDLPTTVLDVEPDIVLYDVLGLVEGDGSDLDALVKRAASVVFAVSRDLRPDLLSDALTRGADGFFSLSVTQDELLTAIESAMTGWEVGDARPDPVVGSSESEQRAHQLGGDVGLSAREVELLSLIARGLSNDEIAHLTFLTINTIKTYIRNAYRKIGVHSRSQAVIWAIQHGFATVQAGSDDQRHADPRD
jgi:DNA-binding NarL/FixJ family response regulator